MDTWLYVFTFLNQQIENKVSTNLRLVCSEWNELVTYFYRNSSINNFLFNLKAVNTLDLLEKIGNSKSYESTVIAKLIIRKNIFKAYPKELVDLTTIDDRSRLIINETCLIDRNYVYYHYTTKINPDNHKQIYNYESVCVIIKLLKMDISPSEFTTFIDLVQKYKILFKIMIDDNTWAHLEKVINAS